MTATDTIQKLYNEARRAADAEAPKAPRRHELQDIERIMTQIKCGETKIQRCASNKKALLKPTGKTSAKEQSDEDGDATNPSTQYRKILEMTAARRATAALWLREQHDEQLRR